MKITVILLFLISLTLTCHAEEINWDRLVEAVIRVESGGNPDAVSHAGAIGLMQITPIVLREWDAVKQTFENSCADFPPCEYCRKPKINLYNSRDNIRIGTWYLHRLHDHYGCKTVEQICAAYNGGVTRLRKNKFDISKMPRETREYVVKVMKIYKEVL